MKLLLILTLTLGIISCGSKKSSGPKGSDSSSPITVDSLDILQMNNLDSFTTAIELRKFMLKNKKLKLKDLDREYFIECAQRCQIERRRQ